MSESTERATGEAERDTSLDADTALVEAFMVHMETYSGNKRGYMDAMICDRDDVHEALRKLGLLPSRSALASPPLDAGDRGAVEGERMEREIALYLAHEDGLDEEYKAGESPYPERAADIVTIVRSALSTPPAAVEGERDPEQSYYLNGPWEGSNVGVAYASRESGPAILVRYGWQQYGAFVCSHRPGHPGAISLTFVRTPEGDYKLSDLMPLPAPPTAPLTQQKQHSILCPAWIYEPCTCYLATQQKGSECER